MNIINEFFVSFILIKLYFKFKVCRKIKFPLLWKFYFSKWKFYFSADKFEQNFTSKNNHKTEFLLSSYKDQMIKVIDHAKKFECLSAFLETQSEKNDLAVVKMISESMERKTQRFYLQTKFQTFPQYIFPSVWSSPMWNKQWE